MVRFLLLLVIGFWVGPARAQAPNVLFILVDDWGWADAGVQGSDFFETPHIDRFAEQSLRFTNAYSASPVCSPTRAAIMTGKDPARLKLTIWLEGARDGGPYDRKLLPAEAVPDLPREEQTLAELFHRHGYFTAHIGKWHLGRAAFYPETQGFDVNIGGTYWGAPATFFYPYRGSWSHQDPELRYVPVGPGKPGDHLTDRLTDHALDLLESQGSNPFFISLWYHTVHTPIEGRPDWVTHFENKPSGTHHQHSEYAAMLASLDENVGRLLDRLDALQLSQNTVVILTSDNGGVDFASAKSDERQPTRNIPFRSGKGTLYEGGIRVPLMIRWPGRTQPSTVCQLPVISQDFLPTMAEALDVSLDASVDGESILPLLSQPDRSLGERTLCWHYPHYYPRMTPGSAIRRGDWKLIHYYEDDRVELYNLAVDPGETHDLSAMESQRTEELRRLLQDWRRTTQANQPQPNPQWQPPSDS